MDNMLDQIFGLPYKNKFTGALLPLFLVIFGAFAAPNLPAPLIKLYDQMWFKIIILFLIAYMSTKNQTVSIVAAAVVLISLQALSKIKIENKLMQNGFISGSRRTAPESSESEMESPTPVLYKRRNGIRENMTGNTCENGKCKNDNTVECTSDDTCKETSGTECDPDDSDCVAKETESVETPEIQTFADVSHKNFQQDEMSTPETHCFGRSENVKGWNGNGEFAQY